jgi:hypothetical protein
MFKFSLVEFSICRPKPVMALATASGFAVLLFMMSSSLDGDRAHSNDSIVRLNTTTLAGGADT